MKHPKSIFDTLKLKWEDTPDFHKSVNENAINSVNKDPELKAYRDYIEAGAWGFGERSFVWMWKLIMDELPENPSCLEIGVHRGAIMALWKLLRSDAQCYGISPMNGSGLPGIEDSGQDFLKDIDLLHQHFKIPHPEIIKGYSTDVDIIQAAKKLYPVDVLYIDGSHTYEDTKSDILVYSQLVKKDGLMIIDDCCNDLKMPWGYFQGIDSVTLAVTELLPNKEWEFLFNVVHNKIFRRV